MQTTTMLMKSVEAHRVRLRVHNGALQYSTAASTEAIDPELLGKLRANYHEIALLVGPTCTSDTSLATWRNVEPAQRSWSLFLPALMASYYDSLRRPEFLHVSSILRLSDRVCASSLEQSFKLLVRRHHVLRSRFVLQKEGNRQAMVDDGIDVTLLTHDSSSAPPGQVEELAQLKVDEFIRERFELEKGPLVRILLIKLHPTDFLMVFVAHHCVFDWWSFNVALREVFSWYESQQSGRVPSLPIMGLQFPEFAQSRSEGKTPSLNSKLAYWQKRFAGTCKPFFLPLDHPPTIDGGAKVKPVSDGLSPELTATLRILAREERSSLFVVILAGFALALAQWRQHHESHVWVLHNGRTRAPLINLVGCFFDTWAMRAVWPDLCSYRNAIRIVQEAYTGALANLEVPSETQAAMLIEASGGNLSGATLFNYVAAGRTAERDGKMLSDTLQLPSGLRVKPVKYTSRHAFIEPIVGTVLTINVTELGDSVTWWLQHDPTSFKFETIELFSNATARILKQAAADANAVVDRSWTN